MAGPSASLSAGSTSSTPGAGQHLAGQREGQLDDVGRSAAGQHLDRLPHLDARCPAVSPSGVDMSVSSATVCTPASGAERDHRLGELAGVVDGPS